MVFGVEPPSKKPTGKGGWLRPPPFPVGFWESRGSSCSFLQTTAAVDARKLVVEMDMSSVDRDIMSSFLFEGEGFDPASGQVTGILSQMNETMEKALADLTAKEEAARLPSRRRSS